jgi:hypothetical protein
MSHLLQLLQPLLQLLHLALFPFVLSVRASLLVFNARAKMLSVFGGGVA